MNDRTVFWSTCPWADASGSPCLYFLWGLLDLGLAVDVETTHVWNNSNDTIERYRRPPPTARYNHQNCGLQFPPAPTNGDSQVL